MYKTSRELRKKEVEKKKKINEAKRINQFTHRDPQWEADLQASHNLYPGIFFIIISFEIITIIMKLEKVK